MQMPGAGHPTIQLVFPTGSQTGPVTVTVNTGTTTTTSQLFDHSGVYVAGLFGLPVLALFGLLPGSREKRKAFLRFIAVIFGIFIALQASGCGGHFTPSPTTQGTFPAGTYLIQVQGTDAATNQKYQAVIQLNVIR